MRKKAKLPDNRQITGRRRANSTSFKPGQSGNPKGAPKRGESWTETIAWGTSLTADEIVSYLKGGELAAAFKRMPSGISMKKLIVLRWLAAQMFEPSPSLADLIMTREEGKAEGDAAGQLNITYILRDSAWKPTGVIDIPADVKKLKDANQR